MSSGACRSSRIGIDGCIYFHDEADDRAATKQIILSVKAGHTTVAHVRDLWGVVEREKAAIGVLITMQDPTQPMRSEAASAGFYESPAQPGKLCSRLQILTVAELLDGKGIDMPAVRHELTFKKAPKAKGRREKQEKRLPFNPNIAEL